MVKYLIGNRVYVKYTGDRRIFELWIGLPNSEYFQMDKFVFKRSLRTPIITCLAEVSDIKDYLTEEDYKNIYYYFSCLRGTSISIKRVDDLQIYI